MTRHYEWGGQFNPDDPEQPSIVVIEVYENGELVSTEMMSTDQADAMTDEVRAAIKRVVDGE